jgi:glutamyl-tRNA synthetase
VNYLALLGWSLTHDRDVFSLEEMVAAFDVADVNPNPARFDLKKAESINGDHIRLLDTADFEARTVPYLVAAGVVTEPLTEAERSVLAAAAPLVQERVQLLGETPGMLGFLFADAAGLEYEDAALGSLPGNTREVLAESLGALGRLAEHLWTHEAIEVALRATLIEALGLKPRVAFGPLRVAVSGRRVSPPLFESMEILGKAQTITRLRRLLDALDE